MALSIMSCAFGFSLVWQDNETHKTNKIAKYFMICGAV
jgi:hypothetical protein